MSISDSFDPTDKQAEIIRTVFKLTDAGAFPSIDELKAALSYGPSVSKAAITCSLRYLRDWGVIEMVYGPEHGAKAGGKVGYVRPTVAAYRRFRPVPGAVI